MASSSFTTSGVISPRTEILNCGSKCFPASILTAQFCPSSLFRIFALQPYHPPDYFLPLSQSRNPHDLSQKLLLHSSILSQDFSSRIKSTVSSDFSSRRQSSVFQDVSFKSRSSVSQDFSSRCRSSVSQDLSSICKSSLSQDFSCTSKSSKFQDFSSKRRKSSVFQCSPDSSRDLLPAKLDRSVKQNAESRGIENVESPNGSTYPEASSPLPPVPNSSNPSPESIDEVYSLESVIQSLILICPFFLWGTAMVAMKGLLPKAGPMFVASVRLIPAGFLLIWYGAVKGKKQPTGLMAWLSIALFALVDATCFQGFLAEGLKRTSAGLGSVIIDSQPLTVAILAALIFGESLGVVNYLGLAVGISGLVLLELPEDVLQRFLSGSVMTDTSLSVGELVSWDRGEWRMLVSAQSMAIGTVMVRWVCKYSDPFMATGWHMVLGGVPLLVLSVYQADPALNGHLQDLTVIDWSALLYTSVGGSAISYGVFFYNATKGSLTKLSSLTFLTPMFAALFGFLFLQETLSPVQLFGGLVTLGGVLMANYKPSPVTQIRDKREDF